MMTHAVPRQAGRQRQHGIHIRILFLVLGFSASPPIIAIAMLATRYSAVKRPVRAASRR